MERHRSSFPMRWLGLVALAALAATGSAPTAALAQPGFGPVTVNLQVVDQNGQVLNGSVVQLLGTSTQWVTPTTVTLDSGPQALTVFPAFQGAMFAGGFALPTANNGLSRTDMVSVDGTSPTLSLVWQTSQVAVSVVDQDGAAVPGAQWGFAGEGALYAPGVITAPINDVNVYPNLAGASLAGWNFTVQSAFQGQPIDLARGETRSIDASTTALAFEWRQLTCNMGVVDGTGAALSGATWSMLGHTFAEGDAITLPVTDATLYPTLGGSLAAGFPTTLHTNTAFGDGAGTFSVMADGSLAPAFVDVNGAPFGLRCGAAAPPPVTTGTLAGTVTKDNAPLAGANLTVVDAASATHSVATDDTGAFTLAGVPQGVASVTLTVPAGTHAVDPASGVRTLQVTAGQTTSTTFSVATDDTPPPPPVVVDNPQPWEHWWHAAKAAQKNRGRLEESLADMRLNFPQAIFDRFANGTTPVAVDGVTEVDPDGPAGPLPARALGIDDEVATLNPSHPNMRDEAKAQLLVVLLNVVSDRLSLNLVVDDQGTTLDQAISGMAAMINDASAANDRIAYGRARNINGGRAGWHHGDLGLGLGSGGDDARASVNAPDAMTPSTIGIVPLAASLRADRQADGSVRFAMTLPEAGEVSLDVYDVTGRHVARLWQGTMNAGTTGVSWSRGSARPGVYFARMVSRAGVETAKAVVAP